MILQRIGSFCPERILEKKKEEEKKKKKKP